MESDEKNQMVLSSFVPGWIVEGGIACEQHHQTELHKNSKKTSEDQASGSRVRSLGCKGAGKRFLARSEEV